MSLVSAQEKLAGTISAGVLFEKIDIDGRKFNYAVSGSGDPLILIHGLNIGWGQWYKNIDAFSKFFTVYAIDLPGAGASPTIDFYAADLEKEFVDVVERFIILKDLGAPNIVGHSIGAWVALKLALCDRVTIGDIVLVNPLGFSDYIPWSKRPLAFRSFARVLSRTAMRPTRNNMATFLTSVLYDKTKVSEDYINYYYEAVAQNIARHPFLLINRLFVPFTIRNEFVLVDEMSKIVNRTLIISADKDPLIPLIKSKLSYSIIPDVFIKIFDNVGHVPPIERSEDFNGAVLDFLF